MPSSYTPSLRLTLPVTGELSGTWGNTVNTGITNLLDSAVAGTAAVTMTDADYTLTTANGATDEARKMFVTLTGTLTAARNVICPSASKLYFIKNTTTGGFAVTLKTSAGTGISVPNGKSMVLYCNGTDVIDATNHYSSITIATALVATSGGTGQASYTTGDILYASSSTALSKLGVGTAGQVLTSSGTAPQWSTLSGVAVTTFSAGTTGFTPSSATSGAVTLGGTLATTNGGTGLTSFTANGVVYASSTSALATGSALTFDGTNLGVTGVANFLVGTPAYWYNPAGNSYAYIKQDSSNNFNIFNNAGAGIIFSTAASEQMRLTSTGLGIGTSSPATKLQVSGSTAAGAVSARVTNTDATGMSTVEFTDGTNTKGQIWAGNASYASFGGAGSLNYSANSGPHVWFNNYTEQMRLDASGNLGLGVTPSAWTSYKALQIVGANGIYGFNPGDEFGYYQNAYYSSGWKYGTSSVAASRYAAYQGSHSWFIAPSGTAGNAISFTQAMTLDASGNLGIGTSSPAVRLDVYKAASQNNIAVRADAGQSAVINLIGNGNSLGATSVDLLQDGSSIGYLFNRANAALVFGTNNAEQMRLDASGNLGLGVTPSQLYTAGKVIQIVSGGVTLYGSSTTTALSNNTNIDATGAYTYQLTQPASSYKQATGAHFWSVAPSGTAGAAITFTQAMTLDNSGNLGLGVTPSAWNGAVKAIELGGVGYGIASNGGAVYFNGNTNYNTGWRLTTAAAAAQYAIVGGQHVWYYAPTGAAGALVNGTGNFTQQMLLDGSGNLGLGVTPSAWGNVFKSLEVGPGGGSATSAFGATSGGAYVAFNAFYNSSSQWIYKVTGTASGYYANELGTHKWYIAPSGTAGNPITFTQAMTLDASGNLGVGTTSPASYGSGYQTVHVNGTNGAYLRLSGATSVGNIGWYDATPQLNISTLAAYPITFGTNSTERMRLDASGNLGLGVTPRAWGTGINVFDVGSYGSLWYSGGYVGLSANGYFNTNWKYINTAAASKYEQVAGSHIWSNAPSGTAGNPITFTQAMTLDASGNLNISNLTASKAVFTDASKNLTTTGTLDVSQGGTGVSTLTGIVKGNGTSAFTAATANTDYLVPALANTAVTGFKTATFNSQTTIATTTGAITIDWTTAQNQKQTEPTGTITYTFTAPPGVCHLQLLVDSDGTSTAQTFNWPGTVIWLGATWTATANKKAIINFWYDGTNYYAMGTNQV